MEDLKICVNVVNKYWTHFSKEIVVVSNGKSLGYRIPDEVRAVIDKSIELEDNAGHQKGNSQLLMEGIRHISDDCDFIVLLEADTWVFGDEIIVKYTKLMYEKNIMWASSEWIERYYSLGLDFAIVNSKFLKENIDILCFETHSEVWVCHYLLENGVAFIYIKENMPTHLPKSFRKFFEVYEGRFKSFPKSKMVTHHIEELANGIDDKKLEANICLNRNEFRVNSEKNIHLENLKLRLLFILQAFFPRSKWFRRKKRYDFNYIKALSSGKKN